MASLFRFHLLLALSAISFRSADSDAVNDTMSAPSAKSFLQKKAHDEYQPAINNSAGVDVQVDPVFDAVENARLRDNGGRSAAQLEDARKDKNGQYDNGSDDNGDFAEHFGSDTDNVLASASSSDEPKCEGVYINRGWVPCHLLQLDGADKVKYVHKVDPDHKPILDEGKRLYNSKVNYFSVRSIENTIRFVSAFGGWWGSSEVTKNFRTGLEVNQFFGNTRSDRKLHFGTVGDLSMEVSSRKASASTCTEKKRARDQARQEEDELLNNPTDNDKEKTARVTSTRKAKEAEYNFLCAHAPQKANVTCEGIRFGLGGYHGNPGWWLGGVDCESSESGEIAKVSCKCKDGAEVTFSRNWPDKKYQLDLSLTRLPGFVDLEGRWEQVTRGAGKYDFTVVSSWTQDQSKTIGKTFEHSFNLGLKYSGGFGLATGSTSLFHNRVEANAEYGLKSVRSIQRAVAMQIAGGKEVSCGGPPCTGRLYQWTLAAKKDYVDKDQWIRVCRFFCIENIEVKSSRLCEPRCPEGTCGPDKDCQCCNDDTWIAEGAIGAPSMCPKDDFDLPKNEYPEGCKAIPSESPTNPPTN